MEANMTTVSYEIYQAEEGSISGNEVRNEYFKESAFKEMEIEYLHFNDDPLKHGTFMHNFEACLERDNPDDSRKLQLLIQHCNGKAREAIESCINLPSKDVYREDNHI